MAKQFNVYSSNDRDDILCVEFKLESWKDRLDAIFDGGQEEDFEGLRSWVTSTLIDPAARPVLVWDREWNRLWIHIV